MPTKDKNELPGILRDLREGGDGYRPPGDDYFAALAERSLAAAAEAAAAEETAVIRPIRSLRWLSAAAVLLILFAAGWFMLDGNNTAGDLPVADRGFPSSDELLAEIDPEEIDDYVSEQIDEFTLELYAEVPLNE